MISNEGQLWTKTLKFVCAIYNRIGDGVDRIALDRPVELVFVCLRQQAKWNEEAFKMCLCEYYTLYCISMYSTQLVFVFRIRRSALNTYKSVDIDKYTKLYIECHYPRSLADILFSFVPQWKRNYIIEIHSECMLDYLLLITFEYRNLLVGHVSLCLKKSKLRIDISQRK